MSLDQKAKQHTIYLVEDEQPTRMVLSRFLESKGYCVQGYENGTQALAAFARARPNLAIIDFGLPDFTGTEVYEKARRMHPDLQVLFTSGILMYTDMDKLGTGMGLSSVNFMSKPMDVRLLEERVAYLCRRV